MYLDIVQYWHLDNCLNSLILLDMYTKIALSTFNLPFVVSWNGTNQIKVVRLFLTIQHCSMLCSTGELHNALDA